MAINLGVCIESFLLESYPLKVFKASVHPLKRALKSADSARYFDTYMTEENSF